MVFCTHTGEWEEPDVAEKERLMGYEVGEREREPEIHTPRRAIEGKTMRWLGASLRAIQA